MRNPGDIFTEPSNIDINTLKNLGPLTEMAGIWEGSRSLDIPPKPLSAPERQVFVEHTELQPIDPQANGPQLFYGLRYHTHIVKPGEVETYHDQVGYWLWEPATGNVIQTIAIPRGQTVMAFGHAAKDATSFELSAERGVTTNGICSNPFLEEAFKTLAFRIRVVMKSHDAWTYDEDTTLIVRGQSEPFHHTDHGELTRVGEPTPNPLARGHDGVKGRASCVCPKAGVESPCRFDRLSNHLHLGIGERRHVVPQGIDLRVIGACLVSIQELLNPGKHHPRNRLPIFVVHK